MSDRPLYLIGRPGYPPRTPTERLWTFIYATWRDGHTGTDPFAPNHADLFLMKGTQP